MDITPLLAQAVLAASGDAIIATDKDGARLSLEFTVVALEEPDGRIGGVAALMRDVTARFEETRELRRKLAALAG
jgi:nitric oxide dioxygenase